MALSVATKLLVAIEGGVAGWSTGRASTAFYMAIPINPPTLNEVIDPILDQTVKGNPSLDQDIYAGVRHVEGTLEGPLYPREIGMFLLALMGGYSLSSGATTSVHTFTGASAYVPSLCMLITDDVRNYMLSGINPTGMTINYSAAEGILTYSMPISGAKRSSSSLSPTGVLFQEDDPWQGWRGTVTGGSPLPGSLIDLSLTINRPLSLLYASGATATQYARRADPGQFEVTGKITADYNDPTMMDLYYKYLTDVNADTQSLSFTFDNGQTGGSRRAIIMNIPQAKFIDTPAEIDRSNVALRMTLGFRALHDTASNAPVNFTIISSGAKGSPASGYSSATTSWV